MELIAFFIIFTTVVVFCAIECYKLWTGKDFWAKVSAHLKEHWIPYVIIFIIGSLDLWFRYFTYWCDRC